MPYHLLLLQDTIYVDHIDGDPMHTVTDDDVELLRHGCLRVTHLCHHFDLQNPCAQHLNIVASTHSDELHCQRLLVGACRDIVEFYQA